MAAAPEVVRARCAPPERPGDPIRVAIALRDGTRRPVPSLALRAAVARTLHSAGWGGLPTRRLRVEPPTYVAVDGHRAAAGPGGARGPGRADGDRRARRAAPPDRRRSRRPGLAVRPPPLGERRAADARRRRRHRPRGRRRAHPRRRASARRHARRRSRLRLRRPTSTSRSNRWSNHDLDRPRPRHDDLRRARRARPLADPPVRTRVDRSQPPRPGHDAPRPARLDRRPAGVPGRLRRRSPPGGVRRPARRPRRRPVPGPRRPLAAAGPRCRACARCRRRGAVRHRARPPVRARDRAAPLARTAHRARRRGGRRPARRPRRGRSHDPALARAIGTRWSIDPRAALRPATRRDAARTGVDRLRGRAAARAAPGARRALVGSPPLRAPPRRRAVDRGRRDRRRNRGPGADRCRGRPGAHERRDDVDRAVRAPPGARR